MSIKRWLVPTGFNECFLNSTVYFFRVTLNRCNNFFSRVLFLLTLLVFVPWIDMSWLCHEFLLIFYHTKKLFFIILGKNAQKLGIKTKSSEKIYGSIPKIPVCSESEPQTTHSLISTSQFATQSSSLATCMICFKNKIIPKKRHSQQQISMITKKIIRKTMKIHNFYTANVNKNCNKCSTEITFNKKYA